MRMNTEAWWNLCKTVIAGILLSITAIIGFKYILPPLLPFITALVMASIIRPAALWCRKKFGLGAKPVSVIIILAILFVLCLLIWSAGTRLLKECAEFLINITESSASEDNPLYRLTEMIEAIGEKFPAKNNGDSAIDLYKISSELIRSGTEKISSVVADTAGRIIKKLPSALFAVGVCIIALFYLSLDYEGAANAVRDFLPEGAGDRLISFYRKISVALWEYLRAYFLIMLVTFAELYLGFIILRIEYSLLFAVVIALVDFLPLLGVGTILVPWSGGAFLLGDHKLGIGLIVIYAIVCVVRQFIEPKIVGNFIGTHPVIALVGVYTGLKLFGFPGMIAAPIILYLIRALRHKEK